MPASRYNNRHVARSIGSQAAASVYSSGRTMGVGSVGHILPITVWLYKQVDSGLIVNIINLVRLIPWHRPGWARLSYATVPGGVSLG